MQDIWHNIPGGEYHFLNHRTQAVVFHMFDELRLRNPSSIYIRIIHCPVLFHDIHDFQRLCVGQCTPLQTDSLNKVCHRSAVGGYGVVDPRQGPYCLRDTIHRPARGRHNLYAHTGAALQRPAVAL